MGRQECLLGSLGDEVHQQASELSRRCQEVEGLRADLQWRAQQILESEAGAAGLTADADEKGLELHACREEVRSWRMEVDHVLQRRKHEVEELQAGLTFKDTELLRSTNSRAHLYVEMEQKTEELQNVNAELEASWARGTVMDSELQATLSKHAQLRANAECSEAAAMQKDQAVQGYVAELVRMQNEFVPLKEEATHMNSECLETGIQLQLLRREIACQDSELQESSFERSAAGTELQLLRQKMARRDAELEEANLGWSTAAAKVRLLQQEMVERETEVYKAQSQCSSVRTELEILKQDYMTTDTELQAANKQLARLSASELERGDARDQDDQDQRDDALRAVCKAGVLEAVGPLIIAGANVNRADPDGVTALLIASIEGHAEAARELLLAHANVNAQDVQGWTPLYAAAFAGRSAAVRALLAGRADQELAAEDGRRPLDIVRQCGTRHLEKFLAS